MSEVLDRARAALAAGDLAAVETLCRPLATGEACYLLAVAGQQRGAHADALADIGQALRAAPGEARYHQRHGLILAALGRTDEALAALRLTVALDPAMAQAFAVMGHLLVRRARFAEALACFQATAALRPREPNAHLHVARVLARLDRPEEAEAALRTALALKPRWPHGLTALGLLLHRQRRLDEASACARQALAIKPGHADALNVLGLTLAAREQGAEAEAAYRAAIAADPDHAEAMTNLAAQLQGLGRTGEAIALHRQAIALRPDLAIAHNNLALALAGRADVADALTAYRQGLALAPDDHRAHSNFLMCLSYDPAGTAETLFAEHRRWHDRHAAALTAAAVPPDPAPGRRLRIGYISPDFRGHSVAYFAEPVIAAHDRSAFAVFCYADLSAGADAATRRIAAAAETFRDITGLPDAAVAELIRADGIDVLVDLAGHTAGNRLLVLARRPAPVLATWIGYPATTGLDAIDYRFTDAACDPPGAADRLHSETLVRLPHGFLCYRPPEDAPPVRPPPSLAAGSVTFGSFNNLSKLNAPVARAWAAIVAAVPGARLLLKARAFAEPSSCERIAALFAAAGLAPERLDLIGHVAAPREHLDLYRRVDIGLDTFPYAGTTTTCEALWMGVPVVTLRGRSHAGRVGTSLLGRVGLPELIAADEDAYVAAAIALANDRARLVALRAWLRDGMGALTDAKAFTRDVEAAYRTMFASPQRAPASVSRPNRSSTRPTE